jgi:hypothetical protein
MKSTIRSTRWSKAKHSRFWKHWSILTRSIWTLTNELNDQQIRLTSNKQNDKCMNFSSFQSCFSVDTLIRRWISSSNQRWIARHYLFKRLIHSIRFIIIIISIRWLDESFQLTIHSRIDDHLIDHIILRLYLMTFHDYVTNRVSSMWAEYLTCEEIENHLYKTLCNHLIKIIHHLTQAST